MTETRVLSKGVMLGKKYQEVERRVANYYLAFHPDQWSAAQIGPLDFAAVPQIGVLWERAREKAGGVRDWGLPDLRMPTDPPDMDGLIEAISDATPIMTRESAAGMERRMEEATAIRSSVLDMRMLASKLEDESMDIDGATRTIDRIQNRFRDVGSEGWTTLREAIEGAALDMAEAQTGKKLMTVPMKWKTLEEALGGWRRGRLHMIQAITSGHKTTLAREAAEYVAHRGGISAYISLEDPVRDIGARSLSARSGMRAPVGAITTAQLRDKGMTAVLGAIDELRQSGEGDRMFIKHEVLTVGQCVSRIYEAARKGAALIAVDFFQLLRKDDGRMSENDFWLYAANALQRAALETDTAVVLCVQPTQEAQRRALRENYVLGLSDLRGGAAISQAAFGVLTLSFELDENMKRVPGVIYVTPQKWKTAQVGVQYKFRLHAAFDTIEDDEEQKAFYST